MKWYVALIVVVLTIFGNLTGISVSYELMNQPSNIFLAMGISFLFLIFSADLGIGITAYKLMKKEKTNEESRSCSND